MAGGVAERGFDPTKMCPAGGSRGGLRRFLFPQLQSPRI